MAQLSNRSSQVVDLTGDDDDDDDEIDIDDTSVSPFHKVMMKQYNARPGPLSKPRPLFKERDPRAPPSTVHVEPTIAGPSTEIGDSSRRAFATKSRSIASPILTPPFKSSSLPLELTTNDRSESRNDSNSLNLRDSTSSLQASCNGPSRASSGATTVPVQVGSRKRSAEEAFRDDRTSKPPRGPFTPATSFPPQKVTAIPTDKKDKGRTGFSDLLSAAEALVTSTRVSPLNSPGDFVAPSQKRNSQVPTGGHSTSSSTAGSLRQSLQSSRIISSFEQDNPPSASKSYIQSSPSPPRLSPPTAQQDRLGSSLRIAPVGAAAPSAVHNLTLSPSHSQANEVNITANAQRSQHTSTPSSTDAGIPLPIQSSTTTATEKPSQVLQAPGHSAFDSSTLPKRLGSPFTEAELVLLIYLKEECNLGWTDLDRKMGRTTNCCATKYLRKTNGVKYRKPELKYRERAAMIKVILKTMPDATIEQVLRLLSEFVETGSVPSGCSTLYTETLDAASVDTIPDFTDRGKAPESTKKDKFPAFPNNLTAYAHFASNPADSMAVRERLRPGARTGEGAMNVRAMMAREINFESEVMSDGASVYTESAYDSSSDAEYHALTRKEYPDGTFVRRRKPYLSRNDRRELKGALRTVKWDGDEDWRGLSIHLDPTESELETLHECMISVLKGRTCADTPLTAAANAASHAQIAEAARRAQLSHQLRNRTQKSIQAMLFDASNGALNHPSIRLRMAPLQDLPSKKQTSTHLLRRELAGAKTAERSIRRTIYDSLAPSRSWTGTSGDVGTLAWSPDGQHFAAGSMCIVDASSMQYNRQNNLLFGNKQRSTVYELPEHHRPREMPKEGANASYSMHVSQDPRLFYTVSMVDFSRDGSHMFSVGYDNFLRSYKIVNGRCEQKWAADYGTEVDLLSTSRHLDLLATGSRDIGAGIRIYGTQGGAEEITRFGSGKAQTFLDKKVFPSALRWGTHSSVRNYLLAGFSPTSGDEAYVTTHGETCLWDVSRRVPISVTPPAGNIFDVAWSPGSARFATACSAYSNSKSKGTRSVIRICSPISTDSWSHRGLELECPARDINDVIFCPFDENYVAAGATNSKVYVWDLRMPDTLLQRFSHGAPLAELEPGRPQEDTDCGVRFCGWGDSRERLVTGSSDGVVKVWDIHRAPRDAHIRDIATFDTGIMSGAFNRDFSSLLIGEVNGTVNLLEVGVDPPKSLKDLEQFHFEPAAMDTKNDAGSEAPNTESESGRAIGAALIKKQKIQRRNMGGFPRRQAVQAKSYDGPIDYAPDADDLRAKALLFQKSMMLEIYDASGKVVRDNKGRAVYREQCSLPLCTSHNFTTEEEAGASGRAADRIPQALREATIRTLEGSVTKEGKMVPGLLRCSHCHGLARPRIGDREQEEFPLCERCGFSCFRCGEKIKVGLGVEKIGCRVCGLEWCIGALGYELLNPSASGKDGKKVRSLDTSESQSKNGGLESMGDLFHLVEDYYQDLWQDKSLSTL
ncbi:hypothetical protein FKW77_006296 [Venturia effusa]|uniref:Uncharacterized protein n=1 Tax=Venturia effusa TaxID=50376 RepID=A0A517LMZ4_9PEZI|nr:hypothetical protein FKW77_006296 [Venturia effusa]